jgi:hypothetical protein
MGMRGKPPRTYLKIKLPPPCWGRVGVKVRGVIRKYSKKIFPLPLTPSREGRGVIILRQVLVM